MLTQKIHKIFKDLPNAFVIANDILIVGYNVDGKDDDKTPKQVMQICYLEKLKLKKNDCHLKYTRIPFIGEVIFREGVKPDPKKLCLVTEIPPITRKNYNHF